MESDAPPPSDGDRQQDGQTVGPIVPSNHADTSPLDALDLPSLVMENLAADGATSWRIYTDTGLIEREAALNTFVSYRAMGTGIDPVTRLELQQVGAFTILYVDRLEVQANVFFEGHGTRPLIVIAKGAIDVVGEIDFSGGFTAPSTFVTNFRIGGPGGGDGAQNSGGVDVDAAGCGGVLGTGGASAGVAIPGDNSGGGGGGGGLPGGDGGDKAAGSDDGGPGGVACIDATLIPLVGGGGGGAGDTVGGGGSGGGGGGAIQLTSMTSIEITGVMDVGGKGGFAQILNDEGGGGGGAGGGILLEAPTVEVAGVLAANGGGGGSGRVDGNHGAQGTLTEAPAPGGVGTAGSGDDGRGGAGGARTAGGLPGDDHDGAGGGGGAVGVVRINVGSNGLRLGPAVIISPQHTAGAVVFEP